MAYSTPLNRTAPNLLRQPFMIAALASVGIHGLLAANFEKISLFPRTAELPPSVQLVELSPLQISRLYPAPPQQLSLGTITAPPSLSTLGPSPTLPEFPATLSTPSFPSFPTSATLPPVSSSNLPSISSSPGISSFPVPTTPIFPPAIPIPNDLPTFPTEDLFKDKNSQELEKLRDRQLAFENLSPEDRAILESMQPDVVGANIFNPQLDGGEAEENYGIPPQNYANWPQDTEATTPIETENIPVDPDNFQGSILADLQQSNPSQQQVAANSETPVTPGSNDSRQRDAVLQGGNVFYTWVNQLLPSYPNIDDEFVEISNVYPAEACPQQLSGTASVAIAMGSGGEILNGPELLSGTGYSVLDNAAMAKVGEYAFTQLSTEVRNQPTAYWYAFDFNPENCATPQPASEATPPSAPVQQTPNVVPPQPQQTPVETQPPVDTTPVEQTPVETQPPVETTPEITPSPFEGEDFPIEPDMTPDPASITPPKPQLENPSPPVLPEAETEIQTDSDTSETTSPPTPTEPTEHKGSLLESLSTPYTEPQE